MILLVGIILVCICFVEMYRRNRSLRLDNIVAKKRIQELENNFELYRKLHECETDNNSTYVENLRKRNAELIFENGQLKSMISAYRNVFGNGYRNGYVPQTIPNGTIEAVKYAMKKAHPDNGGDVGEFEKFRKCYYELTGK